MTEDNALNQMFRFFFPKAAQKQIDYDELARRILTSKPNPTPHPEWKEIIAQAIAKLEASTQHPTEKG